VAGEGKVRASSWVLFCCAGKAYVAETLRCKCVHIYAPRAPFAFGSRPTDGFVQASPTTMKQLGCCSERHLDGALVGRPMHRHGLGFRAKDAKLTNSGVWCVAAGRVVLVRSALFLCTRTRLPLGTCINPNSVTGNCQLPMPTVADYAASRVATGAAYEKKSQANH
jgi:hypothetical protein